jgi:hypothetical protein
LVENSPLLRAGISPDGRLSLNKGRLDICIDTGFSGDFALPASILKRLRLTYAGTMDYQFADGRTATLDQWAGTVVIGGKERDALFMEGDWLLGMDFIRSSCTHLGIDLLSGVVTLALRV